MSEALIARFGTTFTRDPRARRTAASAAALSLTMAAAMYAIVGTQARAGSRHQASQSGCTAQATKRVAPERIELGRSAGVTLTLQVDCAAQQEMHAVLVLDQSISMAGARMRDLRRAAVAFADALDLSTSQVAVVAFDAAAHELVGLTHSRDEVRQAVDALYPRFGSDIAAGLLLAGVILQRGRVGGQPTLETIVLVSDGTNDGGPDEALAVAQRAKADQIAIATIGLGAEADVDLLEQIASTAEWAYYTGNSVFLSDFLTRVVEDLRQKTVTEALVRDVLPRHAPYVWGSGVPAPRWSQSTLTWRFVPYPAGGITMTYDIQPQQMGCFDANVEASAEIRYDRGEPDVIVWPVPRLCVEAPATATPEWAVTTTPNLPTATATQQGQAIFLPRCVVDLATRDTMILQSKRCARRWRLICAGMSD
jgi:Mg-chelatase subunit ChlD